MNKIKMEMESNYFIYLDNADFLKMLQNDINEPE